MALIPRNREIKWLDHSNVHVSEKSAQISTTLGLLNFIITRSIRNYSKHLFASPMKIMRNILNCCNMKTNEFGDDSSMVLILGCLRICLEQIYGYSTF